MTSGRHRVTTKAQVSSVEMSTGAEYLSSLWVPSRLFMMTPPPSTPWKVERRRREAGHQREQHLIYLES